MENTSGFYSCLDGVLNYAPIAVYAPNYTIDSSSLIQENGYIAHGWWYFASYEDAYNHFKDQLEAGSNE